MAAVVDPKENPVVVGGAVVDAVVDAGVEEPNVNLGAESDAAVSVGGLEAEPKLNPVEAAGAAADEGAVNLGTEADDAVTEGVPKLNPVAVEGAGTAVVLLPKVNLGMESDGAVVAAGLGADVPKVNPDDNVAVGAVVEAGVDPDCVKSTMSSSEVVAVAAGFGAADDPKVNPDDDGADEEAGVDPKEIGLDPKLDAFSVEGFSRGTPKLKVGFLGAGFGLDKVASVAGFPNKFVTNTGMVLLAGIAGESAVGEGKVLDAGLLKDALKAGIPTTAAGLTGSTFAAVSFGDLFLIISLRNLM